MCFILELHEVVKASLVVACPSVFFSFYDRGRHAGLLTLKNNTDHTVFNKNQESMFHSFVSNAFSFFGRSKMTRKSTQT